jgi:type II secretory pathway pseudopilin PulG
MVTPHRLRHARGFTYIGLLIMVAVIGVAATATLQLGSVLQRRAAEDELLAIGAEFRAALISYANATPVGQKRMPDAIDDLLRDDRFPTPRRHLRKRYVDPLTGNDDWGTLRATDGGGIAGIYSLSTAKPLKIGNFAPPFQAFEGTTSYQRWIVGDLSVLPPGLPSVMPGQNPAR